MAQNDIYKVTWVFTDDARADPYTTGMYVQQTTPTGFTAADVGAEVVGVWKDGLAAQPALESYYDDSIKLIRVDLRKWDPLEPSISSFTGGLPAPGTITGQSLPGEAALVASLRTGKIGRSYRGRMYFPPLAESIVDSGRVTDAIALEWATSLAGLAVALQSIGAGGLAIAEWGVYSKKLGTIDRVEEIKVDAHIRSQRRRQIPGQDYSVAVV